MTDTSGHGGSAGASPVAAGPFSRFERMIALRYLFARRAEGFISVIAGFSFLGIMLGVATLIVVMAVMNGFHNKLMSKVLGFSGHVTAYSRTAGPIVNYKDKIARLKKINGVTRAYAYVQGQVMASSKFANTGALVRGIAQADLKNLPSINNNKLLGSLDDFGTGQVVAVGYRLARKHGLQVGSNLVLISPDGPVTVFGSAPRIRTFKVVAIFNIGMSQYDSGVVYMPLAEAQEYFVVDDGVSAIEMMVANPDGVDDVIPGLREAAGPALRLVSWKTTNATFFDALLVERNVMFLILTLIILVAAFNVISGLIMLVNSKGRDIAILRTMGATRGAVQRIFLMTGAAIGIAGTLAGIVLGVTVCLNIEAIRQGISKLAGMKLFPSELYYLSELPAENECGRDNHDCSCLAVPGVSGNALSLLAGGQSRPGGSASL